MNMHAYLTKKNALWAVAIILLLIVIWLMTVSAINKQNQVKAEQAMAYSETFQATLSADQATAYATTSSTVVAIFNPTINGQQIDYMITGSYAAPISSATLACAPQGSTGPTVVTLNSGGSGSITTNALLVGASHCDPSIQTLQHLLQAMREGKIYMELVTAQGTLRGQVSNGDNLLPINGDFLSPTSTITVATSSAAAVSSSTSSKPTSVTPAYPGIYYVFVQPDQYSKLPGSSVVFTGSHFAPHESVTISTNGSAIGTIQANAYGTFASGPITIPFTNGKFLYTFRGDQSQIPFSVTISVDTTKPWITLNNYYAGFGTPIIISGHGFGANETVQVVFGTNTTKVQSNTSGEFMITMPVTSTGAGQKVITATGLNSGTVATQTFSQAY